MGGTRDVLGVFVRWKYAFSGIKMEAVAGSIRQQGGDRRMKQMLLARLLARSDCFPITHELLQSPQFLALLRLLRAILYSSNKQWLFFLSVLEKENSFGFALHNMERNTIQM